MSQHDRSEMPPEYARSWGDVIYRNVTNPTLDKIAVKDYEAAGVTMANGVIERCKANPDEDVTVEAAAAQHLWDTVPQAADPAFVDLLRGYRDTLAEYVNRGNDA